MDTHVQNPKETDKKSLFINALAIAREMFNNGKFKRIKYSDPDETIEAHLLHIWIQDMSDFNGPEEVKDFSDLLSDFDYITFEVQDDLIMIGCMMEDVYISGE